MKRGLEALKLYFVIKINVVLLKKEMGANVDLKGEAPTVRTVRRISVVLFKKGVLLKCYVCGKQFRRKEYMGEYMVQELIKKEC